MCNVDIIIPIYHHEENVAKLLMKLTQLNYKNILPRLYLAIIDVRSSFIDIFMQDYIDRYDKNSNTCKSPIFDGIHPIYDDSEFNPSPIMNKILDDSCRGDLICVIEPNIGIEGNDVLQHLIYIYNQYDFKQKLGAICTDSKVHKLNINQFIRWYVDEYSIIRSLDGIEFGNGCMLTSRIIWEKIGKFKGREYTNEFATKCLSNNIIVSYAEGIR